MMGRVGEVVGLGFLIGTRLVLGSWCMSGRGGFEAWNWNGSQRQVRGARISNKERFFFVIDAQRKMVLTTSAGLAGLVCNQVQ